jgi:hypothetical protein
MKRMTFFACGSAALATKEVAKQNKAVKLATMSPCFTKWFMFYSKGG